MSVPTLTDGESFQLRKANKLHAKDEWTPQLDAYFQESVIRNYFNFDMVSVELNQEAKRTGHDMGVARTAMFTADKCRIRWSYLHLLVSALASFVSSLCLFSVSKVNKLSTALSRSRFKNCVQ
jgi:hypothetical protein